MIDMARFAVGIEYKGRGHAQHAPLTGQLRVGRGINLYHL